MVQELKLMPLLLEVTGPTSNVTENFDGTSWTTNPATLATARG